MDKADIIPSNDNPENPLDSLIHFTDDQINEAKNQKTSTQKLDYFRDILIEGFNLDKELTSQLQPDVEIVGGIPVGKVELIYKLLFHEQLPEEVKEQFKIRLKKNPVSEGALTLKDISSILEVAAHFRNK